MDRAAVDPGRTKFIRYVYMHWVNAADGILDTIDHGGNEFRIQETDGVSKEPYEPKFSPF
jgi:hypothetical protein